MQVLRLRPPRRTSLRMTSLYDSELSDRNLVELGKIFGRIDIHFPSLEGDWNNGVRSSFDDRSGALVTAKRAQIGKRFAREYRGNRLHSSIRGSDDDGRLLGCERREEGTQVFRCQPRLIAAHQHYSRRIGSANGKRAHAGFDRAAHSLPPVVVVNRDGSRGLYGRSNRVELRAEDREHRGRAGFGRKADGAVQQRFSLVGEQLLGLAETAAFPRGKDDGSDRHCPQCIGLSLTRG